MSVDRTIVEDLTEDAVYSMKIECFKPKSEVTVEDLDKGIVELVASFYRDTNYNPERRQPDLAFYETRVEFSFEGNKPTAGFGETLVFVKTEKKIKSDEHYLFLRVIGDEHAAEAIESYFRQQIIGFLKKYTQPWKNAKKNLGEK